MLTSTEKHRKLEEEIKKLNEENELLKQKKKTDDEKSVSDEERESFEKERNENEKWFKEQKTKIDQEWANIRKEKVKLEKRKKSADGDEVGPSLSRKVSWWNKMGISREENAQKSKSLKILAIGQEVSVLIGDQPPRFGTIQGPIKDGCYPLTFNENNEDQNPVSFFPAAFVEPVKKKRTRTFGRKNTR